MRNIYKKLPVYTGDVSGVCSALYECEGMVVIHDPSGCNSTYNTHDEIRWYKQESLIFISGLTEKDAVNGNDEKFINDIVLAAKDLKPKFIAIVNSPIPDINGTDFTYICKKIEELTNINTFYIPTNAMHDYIHGASLAFEILGKHLPTVDKEYYSFQNVQVNILGMTPLDFAHTETYSTLKGLLNSYMYDVNTCFGMHTSYSFVSQAGLADVNLVVSTTGLRLAKLLEKQYHIPYVVGLPIGEFETMMMQSLARTSSDLQNRIPYKEFYRLTTDKTITLIGEAVTMSSLGTALSFEYDLGYRVICPLEDSEELLGKYDICTKDEEEIEQYIKESDIVIADPMYQVLCPKDVPFIPFPHFAFSGRLYLKDIQNILKHNIKL